MSGTDHRTGAIFVGIHEDHNAGIAAICEGRIISYCEFERVTRVKNQAGWFPELPRIVINYAAMG